MTKRLASTGVGKSAPGAEARDTFDGGVLGAGAVNAGGTKDVWWFAVGVGGRFPSVDAGGDQMEIVVRGLSSLVKSRADLSARSFISDPVLLVALSLEMNCASEAFRFATGDEAWMLTSVTDLVVVDAVASGAQSRLRGSCQSRLMFQFWYRVGLNPWAWSHCVRWYTGSSFWNFHWHCHVGECRRPARIGGVSTATASYKGHRYPVEIINHCVWLYFRFPLSFREVEELMLVRGAVVSYETIRRWWAKFGPL